MTARAIWKGKLLVGKAIVYVAAADLPWSRVVATCAAQIAAAEALADPLELRPLPLSGIPGWHPGADDEAFYRDAPCFRPLRPGRRYPAASPAA